MRTFIPNVRIEMIEMMKQDQMLGRLTRIRAKVLREKRVNQLLAFFQRQTSESGQGLPYPFFLLAAIALLRAPKPIRNDKILLRNKHKKCRLLNHRIKKLLHI